MRHWPISCSIVSSNQKLGNCESWWFEWKIPKSYWLRNRQKSKVIGWSNFQSDSRFFAEGESWLLENSRMNFDLPFHWSILDHMMFRKWLNSKMIQIQNHVTVPMRSNWKYWNRAAKCQKFEWNITRIIRFFRWIVRWTTESTLSLEVTIDGT